MKDASVTDNPANEKMRSIIVLSDGTTWDYASNCETFTVPSSWDSAEVEEFLHQYRRKGNVE